MRLFSIGEFAERLGVTVQTLRQWHKTEKLIPAKISEGGHRYYSEEQLRKYLGKTLDNSKAVVGYCRVNSSKQKEELMQQIKNMEAYLIAQGKPFEIIQDVGSGIDYKRKGLLKLLQKITNYEVNKIVVLRKDRLVRFGFELIEFVARLHHCRIEVINRTDNVIDEEFLEDFEQIAEKPNFNLQR